MNEQIADNVRQIDETNRNLADHWSMIQKSIHRGQIDEAISLLNAYYRLQTKLQQVESNLKSMLLGHFADK
jgi:hypothetical protein